MIKRWIGIYALGLLGLGVGGVVTAITLPDTIDLARCGQTLNLPALSQGLAEDMPSIAWRTHVNEASLARSLKGDFIPIKARSQGASPQPGMMIYRGELEGGVVAAPGLGMRWSDGESVVAWLSTPEGAYELRVDMSQDPPKGRHCPMAGRSLPNATPTPNTKGLG